METGEGEPSPGTKVTEIHHEAERLWCPALRARLARFPLARLTADKCAAYRDMCSYLVPWDSVTLA